MTNSQGQLIRSYIDILNEIEDYEFIDRAQDTPVPNEIKPALLEIANAFDNIQRLFSEVSKGQLNKRNYNPVTIFQTNIPKLAPEIISNINKCISEYQKIADFKIKNHKNPFFEEPLFRKVRSCVIELKNMIKVIDLYLKQLDYIKNNTNLKPSNNERERNLRRRINLYRLDQMFNYKVWNLHGEIESDLNIQDTLRKVIGNKTAL